MSTYKVIQFMRIKTLIHITCVNWYFLFARNMGENRVFQMHIKTFGYLNPELMCNNDTYQLLG